MSTNATPNPSPEQGDNLTIALTQVREVFETTYSNKANEYLANGWYLLSVGVLNTSENNCGTEQYYSDVVYVLGRIDGTLEAAATRTASGEASDV